MRLSEISTAKLDQYTKAADADYEKAKAAGDYKKSFKRASGMMKASGKKIDNDVKALQKARGVAEATWINGKKQDDKELVWKQTSMSYEEACKKYGKENCKVQGKTNRGEDAVLVKVPRVSEQHLNELDMWAPHTAYIRTAPNQYFKADWRQSEKLTGDDVASFIKVQPLQPQVVKSMGLDAKLNDKSATRYRNRELARGGPIGASGPLADREITLVDLTDPNSERMSAPQLPNGVQAELYKFIEKQGVAEAVLDEIDRRGFLKGLGAAAATAAVPSLAQAGSGKSWTGKAKVGGTLEKNVAYYITYLKRQSDGILIVGTTRVGPSGTSTAVRAIDCNNAKWKYLEDDGTKVNSPWSEFVQGSSAFQIAIYACGGAERVLENQQDVAEGMFGIDSKTKGAIQNVVAKLSDIPNMWDHSAQTFTNLGKAELEKVLNYNPKYLDYALNLTVDDFEADL